MSAAGETQATLHSRDRYHLKTKDMRNYLKLTLLVLFIAFNSCNKRDAYLTEKFPEFRIIEGKKELVGQKIKTFELPGKRLIAELYQVYNYNEDPRLNSMGYFKKDGLQNYLLDSIFYDSEHKDTLKISFSMQDKKWKKIQSLKKKFNNEGKIEYLITERLDSKPLLKKEIFYTYTKSGLLSSETEFECSGIVECDSLLKKKYFYNLNGVLDSTITYKWKNSNWIVIK